MRTVQLGIVNDKSHNDMIGVIPSTYNLCRMYDDKSVQFQLITDEENPVELHEYDVFIRFISGNADVGKALVIPIEIIDEETEEVTFKYFFPISKLYTKKNTLQVQIILSKEIDGTLYQSRSNIITFKLSNSLPEDKKFYQDLSYLDRLVCDNKIRLETNYETNELIIYDDLDNELCTLDIEYILRGRRYSVL